MVRVGAKEGGSHYWEMAVAITCGYGGYLLPLLAAHSSFMWFGSLFSAFMTLKQIGILLCFQSASSSSPSPVRKPVSVFNHIKHFFVFLF